MPAPQGRYFMLTIPHHHYTPYLPDGVAYVKGQLECGADTGYLHWQILAYFRKKVTISHVKEIFGDGIHVELTKSKASEEYVWKEDTRVQGTQFEMGQKSINRNSDTDWQQVWENAKSGNLMAIPDDIRIRCYHTLKRIRKDYDEPTLRENVVVHCFWGEPKTGKSHKAWHDATTFGTPYIKGSTTKWWDGYQGQDCVIIDEFRGQIGLEHLLKWFDKWPCSVEEKGGQMALKATKFWIISNLSPEQWYPGLDEASLAALRRRMHVTHFTNLIN